MQHDPLGLAEPCPLADTGQVFESDPVTGAFSLGHDAFGDAVVDVGCLARFLAALAFEEPPGGFGGFGLQLTAQFGLAPAVVVQAARNGSDRHGAGVVLPGQAPVIEGLRGLGAKDDRLALGLGTTLGARLATFPARLLRRLLRRRPLSTIKDYIQNQKHPG
jgi:hypothetical protein